MPARIAVAALVLSLVGCARDSQTYGPDGRVAHSIRCSGAFRSMGSCFEKAGEICGRSGFDIIAGGNERGTVFSGSPYGAFGSTTSNRNLLVSCKDGR
jgi:hypothetical protein